MGKLKTLWHGIQSSLWFVPVVMIFAGMGLAFSMIELDARFSLELQESFPQLFGVKAGGSRTILSTIASSVIAVAGVTFSVTIVSLSLAASQYTPRVLRNFMRDRSNQFVLGTLVSIFVYCLIVLRTIRGEGEEREAFVPSLSITVAIVLAVGAILAFIYFIHHVATGIQASTILQGIARETVCTIDHLFPEEIGGEEEDPVGTEQELALMDASGWQTVSATHSGYIQYAEPASLMKFALENNCVIRVERCIGDFVSAGSPLVSIRGGRPDPCRTRKICESFGIASYRTIEQDPAFGIRQIVDIALKALSPGINDPTTAKTCIDYLGSILRVLARRNIPSPFRYQDGTLRVIAVGSNFEDLAGKAFHEIRQNAQNGISVLIRLIDTLGSLGRPDMSRCRKEVLLKHLKLIRDQIAENVSFQPDRELLQRHLDQAAQELRA